MLVPSLQTTANGSCPDGGAMDVPKSRLYPSALLGTELAMPEWAALATVLCLRGAIQ